MKGEFNLYTFYNNFRYTNENHEKNYNSIVVKTLFAWKSKEVKVPMENENYEGFANLVAVGNSGAYGAGMYVCRSFSTH